jgi:uncharacterized membrane protein YjjP (DUF1212 family)
MSTEEAVRSHLLNRLESCDPNVASRLSENLDADLVERRMEELNQWQSGWKKWLLILAFVACLATLIAPLASNVGASMSIGGFAGFAALLSGIHRWREKKSIYELLFIVAQPEKATH